MANYRKRVRAALTAALAHVSTGFNPQLASIADDYDVDAFTLDFGATSTNVIFAYLDEPDAAEKLIAFPGCAIYTTEAVEEQNPKPVRTADFVAAGIDFYVRLRGLEEEGTPTPDYSNDIEKYADAVEDAVSAALFAGRSAYSAERVNLVGYRVDRSPVVRLGDGHSQLLQFVLGFRVH